MKNDIFIQNYLNIISEESNKFENKRIVDISLEILTKNKKLEKSLKDRQIEQTIKELSGKNLENAINILGKRLKNLGNPTTPKANEEKKSSKNKDAEEKAEDNKNDLAE